MPDLSGIPALDVVLGLSFVYFLLSIVASSMNEAIAVGLRLRAKTLEVGIRSILGSKRHADHFYEHWRVGALMKPVSATVDRGKKERKPSYIPSRVFALTVLDTLAPPGDAPGEGPASHDLVGRARHALAAGNLPKPVEGLFLDALDEAGTDVARFRRVLERSFDEVMDRAGGWYKRRAQLILFAIAVCLAAAINANSFTIGQALWKDDALRATVVAKATSAQNTASPCGTGTSAADRAADCIGSVEQLDLPLGWHGWPSGWGILSQPLGLLVTAFALTLGAPFWFDLLGRIAHLRGSGPATAAAEEKAGEAPVKPPR